MTVPTSLTVTTAPWGGTYTTEDTGPNLRSYFGPTQNGQFQAPGTLQRWKIPTVHFSLKPNVARPYEPHVSVEVATSEKSIKNVHLYHNTGNRQWSPTDDFTTDQQALLTALKAAYPNAIETLLDEVVNQLQTGVAPTYVAPTAAATGGGTIDRNDEEQFPSLTRENQQRGQRQQQRPRTTPEPVVEPVVVAPVGQQPNAEQEAPEQETYEQPANEQPAYDPQAYAPQTYAPQTYEQESYEQESYDQQAYDQQAYDPNAPNANDPVYQPTGGEGQYGAVGWDPNAPSADDPVYEPTGYQGQWGAVGEAVTPTAQPEPFPADGYYTFTVSDGRRLKIGESQLVEAIALAGEGQAQGQPVHIAWNGEWITLYDGSFEPA
jgi:hypothetical protein